MSSLTPTTRSQLLSHLRSDQSARWQRGERVRVEDYVTQHPQLADDAEAILALIGAEVLHRRESGEQPGLEEYLLRFPNHADELRRLWPRLRMGQPSERAESDSPASTLAENTPSNVPTRREPSAPALPGFELYEKLGEGGMGVVYRAWDSGLGQPRAVKVIRGGFRGELAYERFQREAKAVARLDHPGVVRIYALGEHDGDLFISMEFLEGGNLSSRLRQGPLEIREAVELVRQLAVAVQHAHDHKVLHRDLKPANVLLTADGKPKVGDFGLAKLLDEDDDLTRPGDVMGTPSYMAPEQAEGRLRDIGARTDVWALGVILYECLSGRPPFRGETRSETLELVKRERPASLRRLRADAPIELEIICLQCLGKRLERRYATAAELAADLQTFLDGKRVRVRSSRRRRLWRAVAFAVVLLVGLAVAAFLHFREHKPEPDLTPSQAVNVPFAPGIRHPLLTREPSALRWPKGGKKQFDPELQELQVMKCEGLGLIVLGETSAPRYQIAITMDQTPWTGNIGVFFGYQEGQEKGEPVQRYQTLELTSAMDPKQGRLLQVGWCSVSHVGLENHQHRFCDELKNSPRFVALALEHRLELTVGPEGLEEVSWDGKKLDGLCAEKVIRPPPRTAYTGRFGIYIESGHGIFRDAQYLFQEEP